MTNSNEVTADSIKQVLANSMSWLAGRAIGLGDQWLGSGFSTAGWITGTLSFVSGMAGCVILTEV
jgi:hypothetical protein